MDDFLVSFGSEIKMQDNGHFGGYLVRFSSPDSPDLAGDYFTKDTDFGIKDGQSTPVYFHHRQPLKTRDNQEVVIKAKIGEATLSIDDEGVLIDAIIFNREKYEKAIVKAGRARKSDGTPYLGWSSGTAQHLCDREVKGGANFIKFWQLGMDASVTPTPCEPVNDIVDLKTLTTIKFLPMDEVEILVGEVKGAVGGWTTEGDNHHYRIRDPKDFDENTFKTVTIKKDKPVIKSVMGKLKGEDSMTMQNLMFPKDEWTLDEAKKWVKDHPDVKKSIKGIFQEKLQEQTPSTWQLDSIFRDVIRDIVDAARTSSISGASIDVQAKVTEAANEYMTSLVPLVVSQITDYLDSDNREPFYLKSKLDELIAPTETLVSDVKLEEHSAVVVSAVEEFAQTTARLSEPLKAWIDRVKDKQEFRASDPLKAGRVLSQANKEKVSNVRSRVSELRQMMKDMESALDELMAMAEPKKSASLDTICGLLAEFEHTQMLIDAAPLRS